MAILVDLPGERADVRFVVAPLVELGWAWHVLVGLGHHPERTEWAAALRISPQLRRDLEDWSFVVRAVRASVLTDPTLARGGAWADQLAAVGALAGPEFAVSVLRPLLRVRGRPVSLSDARVLALARARGAGAVRVVRSVLTDPDAARDTFTGLLGRCWAEFFAAEWDRSAGRLGAEARTRTRLAERHGWARAVTGLSGAIRVRDHRIAVDKVQSKRIDAGTRGLIMMPTVFGTPHVYVADDPGRPVVVHYPLPAPERAADSRWTVRRLTALAHPARLEVCRAIAVEPRSAREIARLWGLAESAVTKHLSVLRGAGLVRAERVGHFVRYTLDGAAVGGLGPDLLEVLRR